MIVMAASNTGIRTGYLAGRFPGKIGSLLGPGERKRPYSFMPYALDNGAYGAWAKRKPWQKEPWLALLDWAKLNGRPPLWVVVPDVHQDREATIRNWSLYSPLASAYGWPLAFAIQDGMVNTDIPSDAEVIFVGGSDDWRQSTLNRWCNDFPRVHVGRVNSYRRLWRCHEAGAESCDGTGWFRGDHGSGIPWRGLLAYLEESTGTRQRPEQTEFVL
jgi:hypothetical protein